jgi:hypothetical protein
LAQAFLHGKVLGLLFSHRLTFLLPFKPTTKSTQHWKPVLESTLFIFIFYFLFFEGLISPLVGLSAVFNQVNAQERDVDFLNSVFETFPRLGLPFLVIDGRKPGVDVSLLTNMKIIMKSMGVIMLWNRSRDLKASSV